MFYWLFSAGLLFLTQIWTISGRLDLAPDEPSYDYCIGPGCASQTPTTGEAANDEPVSENSNTFICPSHETSFHPDPTDCHRYYVCFEGVSSRQTCDDGMGYLPRGEICVSERFVRSCRKVNCRENGFKRDPIDCTKYYNCFYGHPYHFQCANGTRFDPVNQRCSDQVQCLKPHNHGFEVQFLRVI